jgi:hypothetical protein
MVSGCHNAINFFRTLSIEPPGYYQPMPERHFPPPWSVEELDSCFVVKDANGQGLAYSTSKRGLDTGFGASCSRVTRRNALPLCSPNCGVIGEWEQ